MLNRTLHAETHLGPDGTKLKQNAQAGLKAHKRPFEHVGHVVYGNIKRLGETDLKIKGKIMAIPNKLS